MGTGEPVPADGKALVGAGNPGEYGFRNLVAGKAHAALERADHASVLVKDGRTQMELVVGGPGLPLPEIE